MEPQDFTALLGSELSETARTTLDTGEGPTAATAEPVRVAVIAGHDDFLVQARDQLRQAGLQPTLFREARALTLWLRDNPVDAVLAPSSGAQDQALERAASPRGAAESADRGLRARRGVSGQRVGFFTGEKETRSQRHRLLAQMSRYRQGVRTTCQ